jgi:hypothetical protein
LNLGSLQPENPPAPRYLLAAGIEQDVTRNPLAQPKASDILRGKVDATGIRFRGTPCLEFCVFGAQLGWGYGELDHRGTYGLVRDSPHVSSSLIAPIIKKFGDEQTIIIDATLLQDHLCEPGQIHLGFHPDMVRKMVGQQNGKPWQAICHCFWRQMVALKPIWNDGEWQLEDTMVLGWCAKGRHRSAAEQLALMWNCLQVSGGNIIQVKFQGDYNSGNIPFKINPVKFQG